MSLGDLSIHFRMPSMSAANHEIFGHGSKFKFSEINCQRKMIYGQFPQYRIRRDLLCVVEFRAIPRRHPFYVPIHFGETNKVFFVTIHYSRKANCIDEKSAI